MNRNNPLVSVVMSVHDADLNILVMSVNSILNQSFSDFELIVIDDINPSDVVEYLSVLSFNNDRVKYLKNEINIGLTKSLRIGVKHSSGKYIARQDSDDISRFDRLHLQVELMENNNNVALCASWFRDISVDGIQLRCNEPTYNTGDLISRLFISNPICHSSAMFRKAIYLHSGGYDSHYATSQDLDLWFKLLKYGDVKFIRSYLVDKYLLSTSVTSKRWIVQVLNSFKIRMAQRERCRYRLCIPLICFVTSKHVIISIYNNIIKGK